MFKINYYQHSENPCFIAFPSFLEGCAIWLIRAVRRAGELLKQFNNERARTDLNEGALTQKKAAAAAGMSDHQRVQAVRVANVPAEKFEAAIERPKPATVTQLALPGR